METTPHVTMDPSCYLRSSWRDPVLGPLTNHRITHYQRLGYYGKEAQEAATLRFGLRPCICGSRHTVFMRYSYLPKAGWYCEPCRLLYRAEHVQSEALAKSLRDKVREANKALKLEADARRALKRQALEIVFA